MILYILRGAFVLMAASITALYVLTYQTSSQANFAIIASMIVLTVALAGVIVGLDIYFRQKRLSAVAGVFLGLLAGLLAAYSLSFGVDLVGVLTAPEIKVQAPDITEIEYLQLDEIGRRKVDQQISAHAEELANFQSYMNLLEGVKVLIGLITCYIGISLVIQTKDDFRFVIPYVEFAKEIRGNRPIILDTSVIIDGRIVDILETRILQGTMIIPRFVLNELQTIADASEKIRRARGRRGLDMLQKIQTSHIVDVMLDDSDVEGGTVDQKLINLAQKSNARVMTNDYNLNKIATLRGVDVVNLNDLAKSLRPVVLPGEHLTVKVVKPGENPTQGVGYLDDGTMIVVESGKDYVSKTVDIVVTSTLQTSAGRMIFGRVAGVEEEEQEEEQSAASGDRHDNSGINAPVAESIPKPERVKPSIQPTEKTTSKRPGGRNPRRTS